MRGRDHRLTRFDPGPDLRAARIVAAVRFGALVVVAGAGSFVEGVAGGAEAFLLLAGLVALPWAIVVLFATDTTGRRVTRTAWVADLVTVSALQVLVPERAHLALALSVAIVVVTAYVVRTVAGRTVGLVALALTVGAHFGTDAADRVDGGTVALFAVAVAVVSLLAERVSGERRHAAAWATHLEGRAAAILDNVATAVVLTDETGVVRTTNPAARTLAGSALQPGAHCTKALALHYGERPLDCANGCALLALSPDATDGVQLWRPATGGRRQPLLANAARINGPVPEIVHSIRDITRLMEADEAKTLFLATASHELKTPLTVINGFAATLLRGNDISEETRRTALVAIHSRGKELAKIVDRLLMSSRIEAGRLALELDEIDLAAVVGERVHAIRAATGRDVHLATSEIPWAWGSADAVATVVDHLLDNALKYSPDGQPVVVTLEGDDGGVIVRVRDGGIGMTPEQVEHCFDKFWQADATDARPFGGTGIGLYIVQSLVDAMGGTIAVRSAPGEGTTFDVRLRTRPAVPDQRAAGRDQDGQPGEASMIREFMRQIGVKEGSS